MSFAGIAIMGCLIAVSLGIACGQGPIETGRPSTAAENVALGEELFKGNCAVCHGANGEGQADWQVRKPDGMLPAPPLNGDGHTWHHGDGTLFRIVSQGGAIYESQDLPNYKSGMPAFGERLSRDEIISVINYVKSLWGDKVAQGLDLPIRESQAIVSETDPFPERSQ